MTYYAPSERRQDWPTILILSFITFATSVSALLWFTWDITDWPPLSHHLSCWFDAFIDVFLYRDVSTLNQCIDYITANQFQTAMTLHLGLPILMALSLAAWVGYRLYVPGGIDRLRHVSGARLHYHQAAIKHAKRRFNKERKSHPKTGLNLHPDITISRVRETGNVFTSGSPGSGKTVFLTPLINQVITRGERAFIYDEKREFTALFYRPETTLLIAPWDKRSQSWNIQADAHNAARAQLIAEQLILDSDDPLWASGARMIWVGMVETLNRTKHQWGWTELAEILATDEALLQQHLQQHYPRAARFIVEQSKTTQSFFAQLLGSLGWIFTLAEAWPHAYENGFSITRWIEQPETNKPIIIVQADKRYRDIGAPLCNALIALMTANILTQTNSSSRELWLFLDELANLPKNLALFDWLSLGRSKGCRCVAGTQSIAQLKDCYGDHGADTLLSMFTMFTSMRIGSLGDSASYAAKAFGEREVERPSNPRDQDGTPSQQWHRETLPLVTPSNLVQLPQPNHKGVEGYLLLPGYEAVYRLRWPYPKLAIQAEEHCPAKWLIPKSDNTDPDEPEQSNLSRREQLRKRRKQAC